MSSLDLFSKFSSLSFQMWSVQERKAFSWISVFLLVLLILLSVPVCTGLGACALGSVYLPETFCLCGLLVLSVLWEFESHPFSDCAAFSRLAWPAVLIVLFRSSVCSRCGSLVPSAPEQVRVCGQLCVLTSLHCPSWLSLEHTQLQDTPFLTVNCVTGFPNWFSGYKK